MADNMNCKHKLCTCVAPGEDEYCSDHCREAVDQDITEIACDCGHSNCS